MRCGLVFSVALSLSLGSSAVWATDYSWDGVGGDLDWGNVTNWNPDAVDGDPQADDTVSLPGNNSALDQHRTINGLYYNGSGSSLNLRLDGHRLQVNSALDVGMRASRSAVMTNGTVGLGAGDASRAVVHVARSLGSGDYYGTLDLRGCTVEGWLSQLSAGYNASSTGGAHGWVMLGAGSLDVTTIVAGRDVYSQGSIDLGEASVTAGSLQVGYNTSSAGGSRVTVNGGHLAVSGTVYIGYSSQSYVDAFSSVVVTGGGSLTLGSTDAPVVLHLGRAIGSNQDIHGSLDTTEGTLTGHLSSALIGRDNNNTGGSHGTLKVGKGRLNVGGMTISGYSWGWNCLVSFDATEVNIGTLVVYYPTTGGSHPQWYMAGGAVVAISNSVAFTGSSSVLKSTIDGRSTGFWLTQTNTTISLVPPMQLEFHDPKGVGHHYWGFKWTGNQTNRVQQNLIGTGKLVWDDTTYLSPHFQGKVENYYDPSSDTTYVGFRVSGEGATMMVK